MFRTIRRHLAVTTVACVAAIGVPAPAHATGPDVCPTECAAYVTGVVAAYVSAVTANNLAVIARHYDPTLICLRHHESAGAGWPWPYDQNYTIVNAFGYAGAYQFGAATFDHAAIVAGVPWLVGIRPSAASVADQDLLAYTLYRVAPSNWANECG